MKTTGLCLLVGVVGLGLGLSHAEAEGVARIADSGEYVELKHQADGRTVVDRLPLYRSGEVRYFSAGVGLEERLAVYPPFSLKMIFTAGGKPFLSGVAVTVQPSGGGPLLTIPPEQVEGPWLFVDLPSGTYEVTATYGETVQTLKDIRVQMAKPKTIYVRWAADRGVPMTVHE
jgi:hypothetical protein